MGTEIENKTKEVDIERVKQLLKKYRSELHPF